MSRTLSSRAFNRGTCQACGRIQKLPHGRLSLHGYTKQWGFFHGTCRGSHHKPFEVSKDLVDTCIQGAMNTITGLLVQRDDLYQLPTPMTKAWHRIYLRGSGKCEWQLGTVTSSPKDYNGTKVMEYTWTSDQTILEIEQKRPPLTETFRNYDFMGVRNVTEVIETLNRRYISSVIDVDMKRLRDYIEWQQKRIENWSPKPLLPLGDSSEERDAQAIAELEKRGAKLMPYMRGSKTMHGWWIGGNLIGRSAQQALAALKKVE